MKQHRPLPLVLMLAVFLSIVVTVLATSLRLPPTTAEVSGVYFGYGDSHEFLRLELDADGTGLLGVSYLPNHPAKLYRIEKWRVADWAVELTAKPVDADAENITFKKIKYSWRSLDGEFGGSNWKRTIKLYNERQWQMRAVPVQERIAHYRKAKQP